MYRQIAITLGAIFLFFIDINTINIPFVVLVFGFMIYMISKQQYNEIALAIPLFGYSFGLLLNKITGVPNLFYILLLIALLLGYRLFFFFNGRTKINVNQNVLIVFYAAFLLSILFSLFQFYQESYPILKLQLFGMWLLIYLLSFNTFDKQTADFNYENFLILIFLFFVSHFSNATDDDDVTLSPFRVWTTYSVMDDGIRGHNFDIISATRIAGAGILAFFIYIYDLQKKKLFLFVLLTFFVLMLIICQTRQSVAAIAFPIGIFGLYVLIKAKTSFFKIMLTIVVFLFGFISYTNYLSKNEVNSRIIKSAGGTAAEGTGREGIWATAISFINSDKSSVGFGNYQRFTGSATYPHNIFLEVYVEMGLISFIILCLIVIYILFETNKIFFAKNELSNLELFLILGTIYYLGLAQFSADLPRNMMFMLTFALYIVIKHQNKKSTTEN